MGVTSQPSGGRSKPHETINSFCRSWNSLNSHAFGPLDTDQYARHIPVGRVCAQRTSRAPLTETDLGNMYAGSFAFAPGPCAYGGEHITDVLRAYKHSLHVRILISASRSAAMFVLRQTLQQELFLQDWANAVCFSIQLGCVCATHRTHGWEGHMRVGSLVVESNRMEYTHRDRFEESGARICR